MTVTKHWVGASLWRLSPHYSLFTWLWLSIGLVLHCEGLVPIIHYSHSWFWVLNIPGWIFFFHLLLMVCSLLELIKCFWSFCTKAGLQKFDFHDPERQVLSVCVIKFPKRDEDESKKLLFRLKLNNISIYKLWFDLC